VRDDFAAAPDQTPPGQPVAEEASVS
jgi:hypothetical protein